MPVDMKNLTFPTYRNIEDATPDSQLGKYSVQLWTTVEQDLCQALEENSTVLDECYERIYHVR